MNLDLSNMVAATAGNIWWWVLGIAVAVGLIWWWSAAGTHTHTAITSDGHDADTPPVTTDQDAGEHAPQGDGQG